MAKKNWEVKKRGFLNPTAATGCTDTYYMEACVKYDSNGEPFGYCTLSVGKDLYLEIYRKADKRTIQNVRKILNEFEDLGDRMMEDLENAKSKKPT
jgi:hypothetical protein